MVIIPKARRISASPFWLGADQSDRQPGDWRVPVTRRDPGRARGGCGRRGRVPEDMAKDNLRGTEMKGELSRDADARNFHNEECERILRPRMCGSKSLSLVSSTDLFRPNIAPPPSSSLLD